FELMPMPPTVAQVIVPVFADTMGESAKLAGGLRQSGLRVEFSVQPQKGLGDQLKYAGRRGIPFAAIAGVTELARNVVAVKDLNSGAQQDVARDDAGAFLLESLSNEGLS